MALLRANFKDIPKYLDHGHHIQCAKMTPWMSMLTPRCHFAQRCRQQHLPIQKRRVAEMAHCHKNNVAVPTRCAILAHVSDAR